MGYRDSSTNNQATNIRVGSAIVTSENKTDTNVSTKNFMPGVASDTEENHEPPNWNEMVKSLEHDEPNNNLKNGKRVAESKKKEIAADVVQKKGSKRDASDISKMSTNSSKKDNAMDSDDESDNETGKNKDTASDMVDLVDLSSDEESSSPSKRKSPGKGTERIRHSTGNNVAENTHSTSFDFNDDDTLSGMDSNAEGSNQNLLTSAKVPNSPSKKFRSASSNTKADGAFKINLKKTNLLFDSSGTGSANANTDNNLLQERAEQEKRTVSYRNLLSSNEPTAKKCNNAISHALFSLFKQIDKFDSSNKHGFPFWGTK